MKERNIVLEISTLASKAIELEKKLEVVSLELKKLHAELELEKAASSK